MKLSLQKAVIFIGFNVAVFGNMRAAENTFEYKPVYHIRVSNPLKKIVFYEKNYSELEEGVTVVSIPSAIIRKYLLLDNRIIYNDINNNNNDNFNKYGYDIDLVTVLQKSYYKITWAKPEDFNLLGKLVVLEDINDIKGALDKLSFIALIKTIILFDFLLCENFILYGKLLEKLKSFKTIPEDQVELIKAQSILIPDVLIKKIFNNIVITKQFFPPVRRRKIWTRFDPTENFCAFYEKEEEQTSSFIHGTTRVAVFDIPAERLCGKVKEVEGSKGVSYVDFNLKDGTATFHFHQNSKNDLIIHTRPITNSSQESNVGPQRNEVIVYNVSNKNQRRKCPFPINLDDYNFTKYFWSPSSKFYFALLQNTTSKNIYILNVYNLNTPLPESKPMFSIDLEGAGDHLKVAFDPKEDTFAYTFDNDVVVYSLVTRKQLMKYKEEETHVKSLFFNSDRYTPLFVINQEGFTTLVPDKLIFFDARTLNKIGEHRYKESLQTINSFGKRDNTLIGSPIDGNQVFLAKFRYNGEKFLQDYNSSWKRRLFSLFSSSQPVQEQIDKFNFCLKQYANFVQANIEDTEKALRRRGSSWLYTVAKLAALGAGSYYLYNKLIKQKMSLKTVEENNNSDLTEKLIFEK